MLFSSHKLYLLFGLLLLLPLVNALPYSYCDNVFCYSDLNGNPLKDTSGYNNNIQSTTCIYNSTLSSYYCGFNQKIDVGNSGQIPLLYPAYGQDFTFEIWVYVNDTTYCLGRNSTHQAGLFARHFRYGLAVNAGSGSSCIFNFGIRNNTGSNPSNNVVSTGNNVIVGWNYVVGVKDSTNVTMYLNGIKRETNIYSLNTYYNDTSTNLNIAGNYVVGGNNKYSDGLFSNARITYRALTDEEVYQNYLRGKDGYSYNRSGVVFEARFMNNSIVNNTGGSVSQKADKFFNQCTDGKCQSSDVLLNTPYDNYLTDYSIYNMTAAGNGCTYVSEGYYNCTGSTPGPSYSPSTYPQLNFTQYSNVTMGVWVWTDNLTSCYGHNLTRSSGLIGINFRLALDSGAGSICTPRFGIRNESGSLQTVVTLSDGVAQDGWRYYVGTKNNTHISLYYDGILQGTSNFSSELITSNAGAGNLEVGGNNIINGDGKSFIGYIDMPLIADRVFTAEEIYQQYLYGRTRLPYIGSKDYMED